MRKLSRNKITATICIPAMGWNKSLLRCLESLNYQTLMTFEVIIILGNKSRITDNRILKKYKYPISISRQQIPGLVAAMNLGLENAKSKIFIRIDDDVVCDPKWFEKICKPFENPDVGGVTGPTIVPDGNLNNRSILKFIKQVKLNNNIFLLPFKNLFLDFLYEGKLLDVSTFVSSGNFTFGSNFEKSIPKNEKIVNNLEACNFAVKTDLLNEIGGFDMIFSKGLGEYHEADIAQKIREKGFILVFQPEAKVNHLVGRIKQRGDAYGRMSNFMIFYKRHFKITNLSTFVRFCLNVSIQNFYHIGIFFKTGNISALGSIWATISEFNGIKFK